MDRESISCASCVRYFCVYEHNFVSLLLGIIEGLTEFLPVSSTAHLRIAEALLGIDLSDGYWKMFSIVIQLGAILCLPIYFRRRIGAFLSTFPHGIRGDRTPLTHPLTLTLLAFVCTAAPAFLSRKIIGKKLESIVLIGTALLLGGAVMWIVDTTYGGGHFGDLDKIKPEQAIWIGLCQTFAAVFPGTSRSMATITAGELAELSRTTALECSFLLSIPTMAAATGYDFLQFVRHPEPGVHFNANEVALLGIGFVTSSFVAWGVVAWFMTWVRSRGFTVFAIYRILLGAAILGWIAK